ncbi:MAG: type II toxin-antitoxin system VapC family toxin [Methylococcales bacterium]|nr:type II toxin-antitoxin system VapC family toxin [Methylococcales bacterium]
MFPPNGKTYLYPPYLNEMKRKVYLETSVISYLTARPSQTILGAAHQQITQAWWETRNQYELFISESVLRECAAGDSIAAQRRLMVLAELPLLVIDENALNIASELVEQGIIPSKAAEDALHIAIATVYGVDYLLTWNCRHIANPELQRSIATFLEQKGLFLPFICTPEELLGNENDE